MLAYHAGAGAVTTYGGIPPYPETRHYVAKVLEVFADLSRRADDTVWTRPGRKAEPPTRADVFTSADPKMPPLTREELDALIRAATRNN